MRGIPEEFHSKIFGKFSRANPNDSRQEERSGLGLSVAKAIVEKHGGRIWFDSDTQGGRGTTFYVAFPERPSAGARGAASFCSARA